jgi:malonate transporter and related proteins
MYETLLAVGPVFALMLLGHVFKQKQFPGDAFWEGAEKLTYYLLLPLLLFRNISDADLSAVREAPQALLLVLLAMLLQTLSTFLLWKGALPRLPATTFASLHQGAVRFNNYIGMSIVLAMFQKEGLALYALLIALAIPLSNLLTVAVMAWAVGGKHQTLLGVCQQIIFHPLVLASLAGVVVNQIGLGKGDVWRLADTLAAAALPLGLMCVGAAVQRQNLAADAWPLALAVVHKVLFYPLLMALLAQQFAVQETTIAVLVLFAALPTASSCHLLSRAMGADVQFMARLTAATTLVSFVTLPLILVLLG